MLASSNEREEMISELDPELFTWDLHEIDFGDRLGLYHNHYPDTFENDNYLRAVKKMAIGWCDPSRLSVRPRKEGIALMCEDENGERFWFHAFEKTARELGILETLDAEMENFPSPRK